MNGQQRPEELSKEKTSAEATLNQSEQANGQQCNLPAHRIEKCTHLQCTHTESMDEDNIEPLLPNRRTSKVNCDVPDESNDYPASASRVRSSLVTMYRMTPLQNNSMQTANHFINLTPAHLSPLVSLSKQHGVPPPRKERRKLFLYFQFVIIVMSEELKGQSMREEIIRSIYVRLCSGWSAWAKGEISGYEVLSHINYCFQSGDKMFYNIDPLQLFLNFEQINHPYYKMAIDSMRETLGGGYWITDTKLKDRRAVVARRRPIIQRCPVTVQEDLVCVDLKEKMAECKKPPLSTQKETVPIRTKSRCNKPKIAVIQCPRKEDTKTLEKEKMGKEKSTIHRKPFVNLEKLRSKISAILVQMSLCTEPTDDVVQCVEEGARKRTASVLIELVNAAAIRRDIKVIGTRKPGFNVYESVVAMQRTDEYLRIQKPVKAAEVSLDFGNGVRSMAVAKGVVKKSAERRKERIRAEKDRLACAAQRAAIEHLLKKHRPNKGECLKMPLNKKGELPEILAKVNPCEIEKGKERGGEAVILQDCLFVMRGDDLLRKGTLLYKWGARVGKSARRKSRFCK